MTDTDLLKHLAEKVLGLRVFNPAREKFNQDGMC